ncbi:hypothetical protein FJT64_001295 [Amphibalanus amphitrite]|uniref:Transposable element P transposase n=1 Tax=Amphibalanus amphitrite TaxID=1232801 RepID=A0A6A4VCK3_AMPAM|nr:hypothetical protein FJT64_001295 [Amphibalanus amphitrite]
MTRRVWFFADVPHCMKNLRNHILDDGLHLSRGDDRGEPVVDADLLEETVKVVSTPEFTVGRKLPPLHVHPLYDVTHAVIPPPAGDHTRRKPDDFLEPPALRHVASAIHS